MFEFLEGPVVACTPTGVVLDVGGIGFHAEVSLRTSGMLRAATGPVRIWVHHRISDDRIRLFGFADQEERELFRALLGISGVGPAHGLALLSGHPPGRLWELIRDRDAKTLAKTRGIGPRTAERVCVELSDRARRLLGTGTAASSAGASGAQTSIEVDAIHALIVLGFTEAQAGKAVDAAKKALDPEATLESLVRTAVRSAP